MINELATQEDLKTLHKIFIESDLYRKEKIRPFIFDSWKRSKAAGINPYQKQTSMIYSGRELNSYQEQHAELLSVGKPIMEAIYDFLKDEGFVIALSDNEGILLKIIGSPENIIIGQKVNFSEGASWTENDAGTNAIGTCLVLNQPVQIFGREHYCIQASYWTCSAAPIHDTNGQIIGSLDISGPYENVHVHTLGIAVTAVSDIETQLVLNKVLHDLELADNYKNTLIDSISEGLIAIDEKGAITHINDKAAFNAGWIKSNSLGKNFLDLFPYGGNREMINFIKKKEYVTDYELNVATKEKTTNCLHTQRPITIKGKTVGSLLLFSEINRARKLIQRMSGQDVNFTFSGLIGRDPQFQECIECAKKSATSQSNVLLLGESGTGKDVLAQAIHNAGAQRSGPFVAVNCSAIPRELIASELFGYVDGAFTGASRGGKPGKFEIAADGTIFLDEIGEMPLELQAMLLRVLETKTVTRLGDNTPIPIGVRIIAATNKDLPAEVLKNNFRQDLFYRLNVITINMIPLRERKEDIPLLAGYFLKQLSDTLKKRHVKGIDPKVIHLLQNYYWPGNVRELQNVLERALNVCPDTEISMECLPPEMRTFNSSKYSRPIDHYERELIKTLLKNNNKNITKIAKQMGITRATLYRKIEKYDLLEFKQSQIM